MDLTCLHPLFSPWLPGTNERVLKIPPSLSRYNRQPHLIVPRGRCVASIVDGENRRRSGHGAVAARNVLREEAHSRGPVRVVGQRGSDEVVHGDEGIRWPKTVRF